MLYMHAGLALIVFAGIPIFVIYLFSIKKVQRRVWQVQANKQSNYTAYLAESINGERVTQSFAREDFNSNINQDDRNTGDVVGSAGNIGGAAHLNDLEDTAPTLEPQFLVHYEFLFLGIMIRYYSRITENVNTAKSIPRKRSRFRRKKQDGFKSPDKIKKTSKRMSFSGGRGGT